MSFNGIKNASSFVILQGYIVGDGKQWIINSPRSGIYHVKWKSGRLPDNAKIGAYVTIIGQLVTLDLGRAFVVIKAEGLRPGKLPEIKRYLQSMLMEKKENSYGKAESNAGQKGSNR